MTNIQRKQRYITLDLVVLIVITNSLFVNEVWGNNTIEEATVNIATEEATLEILPDTFIDPENISGIAKNGKFLILGSDEGAEIQVLIKSGPNAYFSDLTQIINLDNSGEEVDIEGIAIGEKYVFIVGSHSRKRQKVKDGTDGKKAKSAERNRKRLSTTKIEPSREQLFSLELDADGKLVKDSIKQITLRDVFVNHPVFALFQPIPSKENGIDIEGIAVNDKEDEIYIGFRGPVLRGNYTPIMVFDF